MTINGSWTFLWKIGFRCSVINFLRVTAELYNGDWHMDWWEILLRPFLLWWMIILMVLYKFSWLGYSWISQWRSILPLPTVTRGHPIHCITLTPANRISTPERSTLSVKSFRIMTGGFIYIRNKLFRTKLWNYEHIWLCLRKPSQSQKISNLVYLYSGLCWTY